MTAAGMATAGCTLMAVDKKTQIVLMAENAVEMTISRRNALRCQPNYCPALVYLKKQFAGDKLKLIADGKLKQFAGCKLELLAAGKVPELE
jgi:hypothetical protein